MTETDFISSKEMLIELVKSILSTGITSERDIISLNKILEIIKEYTFDDRLYVKGLLSRTIIDSLELEYSIAELAIKFDNDIK